MTGPVVALERVTEVLRSRSLLQEVVGSEDASVSGVSQDSRTVEPGDLFLCWKGFSADGHDFLADAARAGAVAAVVERPVPDVAIPQIVVREGRLAGALAADAVMGAPWREMKMVGITGTNGKTTTAHILRHILTDVGGALGPAAAVGTLGIVGADGEIRPGSGGLTTPGPVPLARWLRVLADEGIRAVVMETSSHGLEQRRLDALGFDVAVFTNLSRDHLDYHGTFEEYRAAKLHLVDLLGARGAIVVNADEPAWAELSAPGSEGAFRRVSFGVDTDADLRASDLELAPTGTAFALGWADRSVDVRIPLIGRHNVENALAAAAGAAALGVELGDVARSLGRAPQVPGRLERVTDRPAPVYIDFAHTPDALEHVLETLHGLVEGRLILVFGAGGDRDAGKREPMGRVAARLADFVIVTSDNPRTEDPEAILDDIEPGLADVEYERIADRSEAIARAIEVARPDDLIVLAGKGHERYQVIGTEATPFDERAIVRELIDR